jgi:hypothetical protein
MSDTVQPECVIQMLDASIPAPEDALPQQPDARMDAHGSATQEFVGKDHLMTEALQHMDEGSEDPFFGAEMDAAEEKDPDSDNELDHEPEAKRRKKEV